MSAAVTTEMMTLGNAAEPLATALVGLEPEAATSLRSAFETMFSQAEEWTTRARGIRVTSVDQKREMKMARESRLALKDIRVKAEHARKKLKEDGVRRGKAIDGIANVLKALIEPIEEHLLEQETFADRAEAAERDRLRASREETLRALGADVSAYANLGATSDETWTAIVDAARLANDARIEAAKQAEAVRVEAERIAVERRAAEKAAAVKAEAERAEREKAQAAENAKLVAEKAELEARAAEERKAAGVAKAEADRAARELAAEREATAAREQAAKVAAAQAEERARLAAAAEAAAPDRQKLEAFAAALRSLRLPPMATEAGQKAALDVGKQVEKMAGWVVKLGGAL